MFKYGFGFIDQLYEAIDISDFDQPDYKDLTQRHEVSQSDTKKSKLSDLKCILCENFVPLSELCVEKRILNAD